ncbi:MAG: hypothetical protein IPG63_07470 [Xanthomonadales bacterium]|nr:hypothetical protein [Xanthomonadales bacterium]
MGQTSAREQMLAQHTQELAQLDAAVRTHMGTAKAGWTLGARNTITNAARSYQWAAERVDAV